MRTRGNGGRVGRRGGRVLGDGLIGRGGDRRDHRRVGRLLRGGLRERVAPQLPRPRRQALAVTCVDIKPARAAQRGLEFGPAELIDSVAVRPVAFYLGPLIFDNTIGGWIFGKLVSDLAFYLIAIVSYERFKALLVRAEPSAEEVTDGSVSTVEAA